MANIVSSKKNRMGGYGDMGDEGFRSRAPVFSGDTRETSTHTYMYTDTYVYMHMTIPK